METIAFQNCLIFNIVVHPAYVIFNNDWSNNNNITIIIIIINILLFDIY
jgi:hypothetical protein